eukprot:TRINITY_DN172_c0_g1_i1.p2 TRINITY_DN172_c0_g1~~TRINITY_DN172_c0_g1_i1.p2  ORF type:complete len:500 (-),score=137.48 TRINITY_DN172_c0_g1_i1:85-1584(-)
MSTLVALGPLLDPSALATIARQLWAARDRLNLRVRGNLPSAPELYFAFQAHMSECDRERLQLAHAHTYTRAAALPADAPPLRELMHYLAMADAAYANTLQVQRDVLNQLGVEDALECKLLAEKWSPGYFICFDTQRQHLVLSIRGSKEMSDFITNLSADVEPFLGGYGHQGVVRSAQRLFEQLLHTLRQYAHMFKPTALVVVGHSLGAAVASAFSMLLRHNAQRDRCIKAPLRQPKCYAFAPPPFVCERLAEQSQHSCDITTLVTHLDLVPRLSAPSVDRLLLQLSHYDWGRNLSSSLGRAVQSVAGNVVGSDGARTLSRTLASTGSVGMAVASAAVRQRARAALQTPRSAQPSSLWSMALNATVMLTSMLNDSLHSNLQRRREHGDAARGARYAFARQFDMDERDVQRQLGDELSEVCLAGCVWHLDRPFSDAARRGDNDEHVPMSVLVRRPRAFFRDVQLSQWMVHDHNPRTTMTALRRLARAAAEAAEEAAETPQP